MRGENTNDLRAFILVAQERSFTRAAARIGVSQSALSHTIRQLEERLGLRLLTRTTRSVGLTEAGERLLAGILDPFDEIDAQVDALSALRDTPAGRVGIVASEYAISHVLWPKLAPFLKANPDIQLEITLDNGLTDIVAEGFDAGVRRGEHLEKDMISARISPEVRYVVVGTPDLFATTPPPAHPRELSDFRCVNFRLRSSGTFFAWEFKEGDHAFRVRVEGQVAFNNIYDCYKAALAGFGLSYVPEQIAQDDIAAGRLVSVLEEFCPYWDSFYLYYPNRRQTRPAFQAVLNALRERL
ncbi:LysR family transcriptional regulator [Celeribacter sp. PS-C1]|uniref:LysR family transcriptional regulator n=1 Tax=Celeribacter sp. PS-C1 TaxID=2820813 RepID=UPI001C684DE6|nr:LysR family transcriptional regulator [Celeribacter sp. PS-C1]MBW6416907.1 LysR family transcriptional regulator [Celeribacter sp. PS-C1]